MNTRSNQSGGLCFVPDHVEFLASAPTSLAPPLVDIPVAVPHGVATFLGVLDLPAGMGGMVIIPLISACQRHSPRLRRIAGALQKVGLGTLMIDLLTPDEVNDAPGALPPLNVRYLADRLEAAIQWFENGAGARRYPVGLFSMEVGTAAALTAAARPRSVVRTIVSVDGRPDLAEAAVSRASIPTMYIAGALDTDILEINRRALDHCTAECHLEVVPETSQILKEPTAHPHLVEASLAWFGWYLYSASCIAH